MKKQKRFFVVAVLILSLLIMSGPRDVVRAESFELAKDTISDSDLGVVNVTHDFEFNLTSFATSSNILRITWPSGFSNISPTATCPNGGTASTTGLILDCTGVFLVSTSTITDLSATSTNPSTAGSYLITLQLLDENKVERENATVRVYILDDVDVTASVPATLTFSVSGTTTGAVINGETTTDDSSTTTLAFGTLSNTGTQYTLGQSLSVITNASAGFSVTVQQSGNLTNGGGDDIDSFATTTTQTWAAGLPTADINDERTYGQMGVTSDDTTNMSVDYSGSKYSGLDFGSNGTPLQVFSHNGPADGLVAGSGRANVAYSIEISALQEAGDYSTTLTYVCTPTY